jgi:hypothetical protein
VRGLPDHQRVPLVLFHFDSASYQEIAERWACARQGQDGHSPRAKRCGGCSEAPMSFDDLERRVHENCGGCLAPGTLLPRVLGR